MPRVPASQPSQKPQPKKGKAKPNAAQTSSSSPSDSDDDDMDYESSQLATQTQTMTQADKAVAKFTPELIERKVGELVQYFLIMEQRKIPVKRGDITKNVLKAEYRNLLTHVLDQAKRRLKMAFGFDLVELIHQSGKSRTKVYVLLNKLTTEQQGNFIDSSSEDPKVGLLLAVLALIFMNGGSVTEAVLWHTLNKLGIKQEEKNHELFGDVRKLLTSEFASKQMYLEYSKIPSTEPAVFQFKWGIRAKAEMTKRNVLEFVCKMYGDDMELKNWKEQYREVLASEKNEEEENSATSSDENISDESDDSD